MNNSYFLGGCSVATYNVATHNLLIRGWALLPGNITEISIVCSNNKILGKATMSLSRPDIAQTYPEFEQTHSGWSLQGTYPPKNITQKAEVIFKSYEEIVKILPIKLIIDDTDVVSQLSIANEIINKYEFSIDSNYIADSLSQLGCKVIKTEIDFNSFNKWFDKIDYINNYPQYVAEFNEGPLLTSKALQHFISLELLKLRGEFVFMDVASSNSVVPQIIAKHYPDSSVYKQDLNYEIGVNEKCIGSNADSIPLPDDSVDFITLHCSWEHFESTSDFDFLKEGSRLLRKGGRLCIIPLYMANIHAIHTSPSVYAHKYINQNNLPQFDPRAKLIIRDEIKQRQSKFFSPKCLSDDLHQLSDLLNFTVHYFTNHEAVQRCPSFALLAESK